MKITLIHTSKPERRPLKFVNDPSDAPIVIQAKLAQAEIRHNARLEEAELHGGDVPELALIWWRNAKWIEIELPDEPEEET